MPKLPSQTTQALKASLEEQAVPVAINLDARKILLDNGAVVPITNMFDEQGHDTDDTDEAMSVVAGDDEQGWYSILLEEGPGDELFGSLATVH
jgi:hypothetical protein